MCFNILRKSCRQVEFCLNPLWSGHVFQCVVSRWNPELLYCLNPLWSGHVFQQRVKGIYWRAAPSQSPLIGACVSTFPAKKRRPVTICLNPLWSGHVFQKRAIYKAENRRASLNPLWSGHVFQRWACPSRIWWSEVSIPSDRGMCFNTTPVEKSNGQYVSQSPLIGACVSTWIISDFQSHLLRSQSPLIGACVST